MWVWIMNAHMGMCCRVLSCGGTISIFFRTASCLLIPSQKKGRDKVMVARQLMPALGRQRQVDLCEFKASLVYRVSSRTARVRSCL